MGLSSAADSTHKDEDSAHKDLDLDSTHTRTPITDPHEGQLRRALPAHAITLLAIGGIIGPGLLVGLGSALAKAGPAGTLIGFGATGVLIFLVMQGLGEMCTALPVPGGFVSLAERFWSPALSVAVGYAYIAIWLCVLANELVSSALLVSYWPAAQTVPVGAWIAIFLVIFLLTSCLGVRIFGELESLLSIVKLAFLFVFFIIAIVITAGGTGQPSVGFRYYRDPGAFHGTGTTALNGVVSTLVVASTLYSGVESTAVIAGEAKNPARAVPSAIRSVWARIFIVYIGSVFFCALCVPWNDQRLISGGSKTGSSPFTIAMQRGGLDSAADAINAIILVSVFSAGNSSLYIASRTLQSLAARGQAPRFLAWTTKKGKTPLPALFTIGILSLFSLLSIGTGTAQAFSYIIQISGVCTFIVWASIALIHLRFRAALRAQGGDPKFDLVFYSRWCPWGTWVAFGGTSFFALIQGYGAFLHPFNKADFITSYIALPVFFLVYFGWTFWFKNKIVKPHEADLVTGRRWKADVEREKAEEQENNSRSRGHSVAGAAARIFA